MKFICQQCLKPASLDDSSILNSIVLVLRIKIYVCTMTQAWLSLSVKILWCDDLTNFDSTLRVDPHCHKILILHSYARLPENERIMRDREPIEWDFSQLIANPFQLISAELAETAMSGQYSRPSTDCRKSIQLWRWLTWLKWQWERASELRVFQVLRTLIGEHPRRTAVGTANFEVFSLRKISNLKISWEFFNSWGKWSNRNGDCGTLIGIVEGEEVWAVGTTVPSFRFFLQQEISNWKISNCLLAFPRQSAVTCKRLDLWVQ